MTVSFLSLIIPKARFIWNLKRASGSMFYNQCEKSNTNELFSNLRTDIYHHYAVYLNYKRTGPLNTDYMYRPVKSKSYSNITNVQFQLYWNLKHSKSENNCPGTKYKANPRQKKINNAGSIIPISPTTCHTKPHWLRSRCQPRCAFRLPWPSPHPIPQHVQHDSIANGSEM